MSQTPNPNSGHDVGYRAITSYTPKTKGEAAEPAAYPLVRECMDTTFVTLRADTPVYAAIETLLDARITGAAVVDDEGQLAGILSEKDCLRVLTGAAYDGLPGASVADYMTKDVHTVRSDADVLKAVTIFLANPFRRLLVVDDDRLVGQITRRDLLRVVRQYVRDNRSAQV